MTNQEIYDRVKAHLLTQNKKSLGIKGFNSGFINAYHSADGLKCSIGCLIPDELYTSDLEGAVVAFPHVQDVLIKAGVLNNDLSNYPFLSQLQTLHDYVAVEEWENELKLLAENYNLKP